MTTGVSFFIERSDIRKKQHAINLKVSISSVEWCFFTQYGRKVERSRDDRSPVFNLALYLFFFHFYSNSRCSSSEFFRLLELLGKRCNLLGSFQNASSKANFWQQDGSFLRKLFREKVLLLSNDTLEKNIWYIILFLCLILAKNAFIFTE